MSGHLSTTTAVEQLCSHMLQLRKSDFGRKTGKRTDIKPVPKQESSSAQWRNTMTDKGAKILNT